LFDEVDKVKVGYPGLYYHHSLATKTTGGQWWYWDVGQAELDLLV
jgi:hypothetical protein